MRFAFRFALASALLLGSFTSSAETSTATGTLVLDLEPFRSEVALKPKIESQLKTGGIEWGLRDGQMVVTLLNKRFVDFDVSYMTRYGSNQTLQLPAGSYRLTTVGFEPHTGFSVEKVLAKGAYVNQDVMAFTIEPGKTTTMVMEPLIVDEERTLFATFFTPTLFTTVSVEGAVDTGEKPVDPVALNVRDDRSIAWPDYKGPLKFVAK
ncbi:hypothetical protein [uncultured Stenotrophomonas sp.]|uniref:hypothetical protein n=1 Tax=uncultured Stenotrophomonas sp. TaxID=165438 RepID=UPI0028E7F471|nr:hypothetical protein [uncultured Stenotrophomonas sp.]